MEFNPFTAIGSFILGAIRNGQVQAWTRLIVAILGTSFVSFFGVFGLTVPLIYKDFGAAGSLVIGLAAGCLAMATSVLFLWRKSKLTKGLPMVVPGNVEEALNKILVEETMVMSGEDKK